MATIKRGRVLPTFPSIFTSQCSKARTPGVQEDVYMVLQPGKGDTGRGSKLQKDYAISLCLCLTVCLSLSIVSFKDSISSD